MDTKDITFMKFSTHQGDLFMESPKKHREIDGNIGIHHDYIHFFSEILDVWS